MKNAKILCITSNDAWGAQAARLGARYTNVLVARDVRSLSISRVLKLLFKREHACARESSLRLSTVFRQLGAMLQRVKEPCSFAAEVACSADILRICQIENASVVILFRAGIYINRQLLETVPQVFNIHCADIYRYGGLNAIGRIRANKERRQWATLHRVTPRIDEGPVVALKEYRLNPAMAYCSMEDAAYHAGLLLLEEFFDKNADCPPLQSSTGTTTAPYLQKLGDQSSRGITT